MRGYAALRRLLALALLILFLPGCQQKMADQPSYQTLRPSDLFADGRSARPLPDGVIARDQFIEGSPLVSGLRNETNTAQRSSPADSRLAGPNVPSDPANYVDFFPFAIHEADLKRGGQRFGIFCTPCHGPEGEGDGKIVERGYLRPPSYHTDLSRGFGQFGRKVSLREAPAGYLFEVVSRGYGAMPDYAAQITVEDRWRIVAYVRVLQLSQHANLRELPADEARIATDALGGRR